jgi:antitoxin (DNA-binding transcriptional repressor) of toxin-antitoxin stability system
MYALIMDVSITKFRRDLFELVGLALDGSDIRVTHKGRRVRLVPEEPLGRKLDRITKLQVIAPEVTSLDDPELKEEMERALEEDWKAI